MLHSHTLRYEGHKGLHILQQNAVMFYDIQFKDMLEALNFLKHLEPSDQYIRWKYGPCVGVFNEERGYYFNGVWFKSAEQAFEYYKIMSAMK